MAYNSKRNGGEVEHLLDYTSQLETSLPEKFSEVDKRIAQTEKSTESIQEKLPSLENAKATTYEKLVTMCHAGELVRGTDYKFVFKTIYRSGGVNKESDTEYTIIAHAISKNKISSDVKIYEHPEWEVKYTMEDGDTRLDWSREDDMGQIYYLKDERGNSAGFDFKNIEMPMYKHLTSLGYTIWLGTTKSICNSLYVEEVGWFKLFSDDTKLYNVTIKHEFGKLPNSHINTEKCNFCGNYTIELKNSYLEGSVDLLSVNAVNSYINSTYSDVKYVEDSIVYLIYTKGYKLYLCEGIWGDTYFLKANRISAEIRWCALEYIYGGPVNFNCYRAHSSHYQKSDSGTWNFNDLKISNTAGKAYSAGKHKTVKFSRNVDFTIEQRYNFKQFADATSLSILGYANSATDDAYIAMVDGKTMTETRYVFPKGDTPQLVQHDIQLAKKESHTIRFGGAQVCAVMQFTNTDKNFYTNINGKIYLPNEGFYLESKIIADSTRQFPKKVYTSVINKDYVGLGYVYTTDQGVFYPVGNQQVALYSVSNLKKFDDGYHLVKAVGDDFSMAVVYAELWEYLHPCMKEFYSETKGVITHRLVDPYTLIEVCDEKQLSKYDNDAGFITEQDYFSEVEVTDTEAVQTIKPNVFYKFGVRDNLEIIFDNASEKKGIVNEYRFEFKTTTDSVITLPSSILWEEEPVFENGTIYQISVLNNVGCVAARYSPTMPERYMWVEKDNYSAGDSADFDFTFSGHIYYSFANTSTITWTYLPPNTILHIGDGQRVYLKARLEDNYDYENGIGRIGSGYGYFKVGGNIRSLCLYDSAYNAAFLPPDYCFNRLFSSSSITDAQYLDLTVLRGSYRCFYKMFSWCNDFYYPPNLPNIPLGVECCAQMFIGCNYLDYIPDMPSQILGTGCYTRFIESASYIRHNEANLPAEHIPAQAYEKMFAYTNINSVKMLCKSFDENAFGTEGTYWLPDNGGTIYIHPDTSWTHEDLNIPTSWTIEKAVLDETNNE